MLDQSKIPGLKELANALCEVLPEDNSKGDPRYLSMSALDICTAANWSDDAILGRALLCAQRYWAGTETDVERERVRQELLELWKKLKAASKEDSPQTARYALVMWSLDVVTPSNGFSADHLLDNAVRAGVTVRQIRDCLEKNIPGLTEALIQMKSR